MEAELQVITQRLLQAKTPEDVFGDIRGKSAEALLALRQSYHALVKAVHPDLYFTREDKSAAQTTLGLLIEWFGRAEAKVKAGTYGESEPAFRIETKKREYGVQSEYVADEIYNAYPCHYTEGGRSHPATLKLVRDPRNNDFSLNEIRILQLLAQAPEAEKFAAYLPELLEAFVYQEGGLSHQATIFKSEPGWYSLAEVRQKYSGGIDPKDMAWIWRRLLVVLGFAHRSGVLHGAVLPVNVWILPEEHGLRLGGWGQAVHDPENSGERISTIDLRYMDWYPREVLEHAMPCRGTDLVLSAKCMLFLLGGDPNHAISTLSIPEPLRRFFRGCLLPGKKAPQDAWALLAEFDELLARLWGKRTFHPFSMKYCSLHKSINF